MDTRKIALVTILTATSLGIQLAPRPPNVEFTSFLTFLVGFSSGMFLGALSGLIVVSINGFVSPWGSAGMNLPFQAAGMVIAGAIGGLYRKHLPMNAGYRRFSGETAVLGALTALLYDLITNLGFALLYAVSGITLEAALFLVFASGILFSVIHVLSCAAIFGAFFLPFMKIYKRSPSRS